MASATEGTGRSSLPFLINFFFLYTTFAVVAPYLQIFLRVRGFAASEIGLLLGSFEIAGVAGPLVIGQLADRTGRYRRVLIAAIVASVAFFLPLRFAEALPVALFFAVALGFAYKPGIPLTDALATRSLPDPTHQYGRVRIAGSLGFVVGSLVFQFSGLLDASSATSILLCFAGASVFHVAAATTLPRSTESHAAAGPNPGGLTAFDWVFWLGIAVVFLGRFGITAHYSFFSLYLVEEFGYQWVSLVWVVGAAAEIPVIFFSGALIRRFGLGAMFAAALLGVSARLVVYTLATGLPAVVGAQLLHALTFGVFHTAGVAFVQLKVHPSRRALGMAVYMSLGIGVPGFLGSAAGGYLLEHLGFRTMFGSYAVVPILGVLLLLLLRKPMRELSLRSRRSE